MKKCKTCNIELTNSNWIPSHKVKGSLKCRSCVSTERKEYYKTNKTLIDTKAALYREQNPEMTLWSRAKQRAKKKRLEFSINVEDVKIPSNCPILDIPLEKTNNKNNSPSLDRIDPSKGYVKGNIQVISWRANNLKSDGTLEEFQKLVAFLKG